MPLIQHNWQNYIANLYIIEQLAYNHINKQHLAEEAILLLNIDQSTLHIQHL